MWTASGAIPSSGLDGSGPRVPHTHVFGHTHFSIDRRIDGVRYVQQPLGNPSERSNGWQIRSSEREPFMRVWQKR